jgi:hypothetical protein
MMKKMAFVMGCYFLLLPFLAHGFDCNKPDFGARLEELNKDGYFVKYMEKDGVAYYNYTGPCRMDMHEESNPAYAFAFIDNQLYARIARFPLLGRSPEYIKDKMEKIVSKQIGTITYEKKRDGDWSIYQWTNKQDKIKFKVKINTKIQDGKAAFYYEPLRAKLLKKSDADEPNLLGF